MNARLTRTRKRRILLTVAGAFATGALLGYVAAPNRPWIFAHLTPGSYLATFPSLAQCEAARTAFGAGRGIPTDAPLTIGTDYVDLCATGDRPIGEPVVHLDLTKMGAQNGTNLGSHAARAPRHVRASHVESGRRRQRTCRS